MSCNLIVSYSYALSKQIAKVWRPPAIGTIRPSQNSGIFYSKLLGLSFLEWSVPARPSPKRTLNLKPGTFAPRAFDLDSNRSRTAVNRAFLGSRRYQRRFTLWAAATRGGVELESNCSRTAVTLRFSGKAASSRQSGRRLPDHCPPRRHELPKQTTEGAGVLPARASSEQSGRCSDDRRRKEL